MPGLMELLSYAGNALDLPASSLRDLFAGSNPFDQWATPFSSDNRTSGRDLLNPIFGKNKETGMAGWLDDPMEGVADVLGFGAEMVLDPLNLVSGAGVMKALKGRKAAKSANKVIAAENAANAGKYGYVNAKLAGQAGELVNPITQKAPHWQDQIADLEFKRASLWDQAYPEDYGTASIFADVFDTTDDQFKRLDDVGLRQQYDDIGAQIDEIRRQNPMKLLGYTPERPTVYHGGHDWSASATPENPYGMFDVGRLKTGEGANAYGPGAYFAEAEDTSLSYKGMVSAKLKRVDPRTDLMREVIKRSNRQIAEQMGGSRNVRINPLLGDVNAPPPESVKDILSALEENDWLGADIKTLRGRERLEEMLHDGVGLDGKPIPDGVRTAFGKIMESVQEAKLYKLDVPHDFHEKVVDWSKPYNQQHEPVQSALLNSVPGLSNAIDEYADARQKWGNVRTDQRKSRVYDPDYLDTPRGKRLDAARSSAFKAQNEITEELVRRSGLPEWEVRNLLENAEDLSGEDIARILLKGSPNTVPLSSTESVSKLGVAGTRNLAASTGRNTYNYAIWDQDLLNQMRIRAIDGERVPINPTTLVQQVAKPLPQAADPTLMRSMNPMRPLQQLPGLAAPAATSAVYNVLARQNNYGGVM